MPPWLVQSAVRRSVALEPAECDTGVVQIDSLRLDERATVARAAAFMETLPERVGEEAGVLRSWNAALVVADIPALGIAAARAAGVPAVALGNFSWDWAYAAYEDGAGLAESIAAVYRTADLALRLPLWGGFDAFPRVVDLPFIARRSRRDPSDTRRALGLPDGEPLVLVSFGGYGVEGLDLEALARVNGMKILVSASTPFASRRALGDAGRAGSVIPLDEPAVFARGFRYEDLVAAVDVVVTKPGYGIIAECTANDTAILYTSRGRFIEYDVLVAGMHRFVRAAFLGHDDLFAGRWADHVARVLAAPPPPERPRVDGAEVAADLLAELL